MTALFAISTCKPRTTFVKRRYGYEEHIIRSKYFYVREVHNSNMYAIHEDQRIQMLAPLIEDLRLTHDDPDASFFALVQKGHDSMEKTLMRGANLPLQHSADIYVSIDEDHRLTSAF